MEADKTKKCSKCKRELPATSYYFHIDRQKKDGLHPSCKDCKSKQNNPSYTYHGNRKNGMRKCTKCGEWKPATKEYFYGNVKVCDGLHSNCKKCAPQKIRITKRRWANKPKHFGHIVCTCCGVEYIANSDFFQRSTRSQTGFCSICKPCQKNKNRENRNKINERRREYRKNNVQARISNNIRSRIRTALRDGAKTIKSQELLGCSFEYFKLYLESLFLEGMSWDLFMAGKIHIDHIRPCASFDMTKIDQQRECFHYTNIQPMWAFDNFSKGSFYNGKRYYSKKD